MYMMLNSACADVLYK